jgi:ABC-type Zn2+ transport system substrate-binding protein/surface adhesin
MRSMIYKAHKKETLLDIHYWLEAVNGVIGESLLQQRIICMTPGNCEGIQHSIKDYWNGTRNI